MKKLSAFLLLLCAVSCSQRSTQHAFQESPVGAAPTAAAETPVTNPTEGQFHPTRTNALPVTPLEEVPPAARVATNMPEIAQAAPVTPPLMPEVKMPAGTINFPAADLKDVLKIYAELVNRTVLQPANLGSPQITLRTQTELTKGEAILALESVLALNGISMINIGDKFVKVVPAAQANMEGAPTDTRTAGELPELGQYLTHVVQLKYVKPSEMIPAIAPFAKLNSILPIDASQILIIRDYVENVKRMLEMIERIDVIVPSEFISEVIFIKYAKASEISGALSSLGAGGGATFGGGGGGGAAGGTTRPTPGAGARGGAATGGINRPGGLGAGGNYGGMNTPGRLNTPGAPGGATGSSFTDNLNRIIQRASGPSGPTGELQLFGQMKMIADERSNSLLIFASRADMEMIKTVISKLDVVLAQVLIETLILDVQIGSGWNYGISAGQPPRTNSIGAIGGVANNSGNQLDTLARFFSGLGITNGATTAFPAASGLSYFGRYNGNLDLAIQAAASDNRVNVVQRPQILTTHATPGSIFVGSTVPYVTGSSYGGAYGAGNSYQQLQVGIGLDVTPFINQEGLVVMEIAETIDEISGSIEIANVGAVPTTTKRTLSASVAVRDGETIILGGFIRNSDSKSASGVPILRDIPLLGKLFESRSNTKARNELLVLMRPSVLRTPELAAVHTTEMKKVMPGVLRAEAELKADENRQLDQDSEVVRREQQKALKRKTSTGKAPQ